MSDKPEKCAHPSCACTTAKDSKFCSTFCEGASDHPDIICNCGHPSCADHSHATIPSYPAEAQY